MAKLFFLCALIIFWMQPTFLRADDYENLAKIHHVTWPYTLVTYNYKNEKGQWEFQLNLFKDLPFELQNKDWECWIDFDESNTCRERN
jgi:hypothetical protein